MADDVTIAINEMKKARNGGDYAAIFQGKKLAFKFSSIREATTGLSDAASDISESLTPVIDAIPDSSIVEAVMAAGRVIKAGGAEMLRLLQAAFSRLIAVFESLKEALSEAFRPIMEAMNLLLEGVIQLLLDLIPNAFIEFVQGIIAAIMPFIGQIKACGNMLLAVGDLVYNFVVRHQLIKAAAAIDENNRFSSNARNAVLRIIEAELIDSGANAALETVNAGASVAGLVFTGNVAGTVAGIATSVAKMCIMVMDLMGDINDMQKGNSLLVKMLTDPRRDVNPVALFNAAPILGAFYIAQATQSSLIANTGFLDSAAVKLSLTNSMFMANYQAKASELSPFRLKAMRLANKSRLELTESSTMGVVFDFNLKDEVKERISGALVDNLSSAVSNQVSIRLGI